MKREVLYPVRYLTSDEWNRLDTLTKDCRNDLILWLLYTTGCTVNELVNLRTDNVDFKKGSISISESSHSKEERKVYISKRVLDKIRLYIRTHKPGEYLLSTRQSEKMTTKRVRQIVKELCTRIRIQDATPQIIRYTHIVHAYKKNIPVDAIQQQVGLKRSRAIEIFNQLRLSSTKEAYKVFDS